MNVWPTFVLNYEIIKRYDSWINVFIHKTYLYPSYLCHDHAKFTHQRKHECTMNFDIVNGGDFYLFSLLIT